MIHLSFLPLHLQYGCLFFFHFIIYHYHSLHIYSIWTPRFLLLHPKFSPLTEITFPFNNTHNILNFSPAPLFLHMILSFVLSSGISFNSSFAFFKSSSNSVDQSYEHSKQRKYYPLLYHPVLVASAQYLSSMLHQELSRLLILYCCLF